MDYGPKAKTPSGAPLGFAAAPGRRNGNRLPLRHGRLVLKKLRSLAVRPPLRRRRGGARDGRTRLGSAADLVPLGVGVLRAIEEELRARPSSEVGIAGTRKRRGLPDLSQPPPAISGLARDDAGEALHGGAMAMGGGRTPRSRCVSFTFEQTGNFRQTVQLTEKATWSGP